MFPTPNARDLIIQCAKILKQKQKVSVGLVEKMLKIKLKIQFVLTDSFISLARRMFKD